MSEPMGSSRASWTPRSWGDTMPRNRRSRKSEPGIDRYLRKSDPGYEEAVRKARQLLLKGARDVSVVSKATGLSPLVVRAVAKALAKEVTYAGGEIMHSEEAEQERPEPPPPPSDSPTGRTSKPWVFSHRHASARVVLESGTVTMVNGRTVIQPSRVVQFRHGLFPTTDPEVAEALRKHPRFGTDIVEVKPGRQAAFPQPQDVGERIVRHFTTREAEEV